MTIEDSGVYYVDINNGLRSKTFKGDIEVSTPVVHTKLGSVRGKYVGVKAKGKDSSVLAGNKFLSLAQIPWVNIVIISFNFTLTWECPLPQPPVGPLRLKPPQPAEKWEGVRDATQQPFMTVMVWIHGGGLAMGSASMYDGSALAAYQDMVVVLVQYRLGGLGFLSYQVIVDGHFLTKPVDELYQIHELHKTPFMTGINGHEAGWLLPRMFAPLDWTEGMDLEDTMAVVATFYPEYGAEEDYLSIGLEQVPAQHLKKDRYTFLTQTLPEKIRRWGQEHGEL